MAKSNRARGRYVEKIAEETLKGLGFLVQRAPDGAKWIPRRGPTVWVHQPGGQTERVGESRMPISTRRDFFGLWDFIAVSKMQRSFIQVTVESGVSARRRKLLESDFPLSSQDFLMVYLGRNRFRVFYGPDFRDKEEEWGRE